MIKSSTTFDNIPKMRFVDIKKGQYFKRKGKTNHIVKFKKISDDAAKVIQLVDDEDTNLAFFYKVGEIIRIHQSARESYEYDYELT